MTLGDVACLALGTAMILTAKKWCENEIALRNATEQRKLDDQHKLDGQRILTELRKIAEQVQRKEDKLVVVDLHNAIGPSYFPIFFNGFNNVILITSKNVTSLLYGNTTLDKVGGTALVPEVDVSNVFVVYGSNLVESKVMELLKSDETFTLFIEEQKIRLENSGEHIVVKAEYAPHVLDIAFDLAGFPLQPI